MEIDKAQARKLLKRQRQSRDVLNEEDTAIRIGWLNGIPGLRDAARDDSLDYWIDNVSLKDIAIPGVIRPTDAIRRLGEIGAKAKIIDFYQAYQPFRDNYVSSMGANLRKTWSRWAVGMVDADLVNPDEVD
jgi:hypothetical protein